MRPTLTIDELRLTLPAGFEHRADAIARLVAGELSHLPVTRSARLEALAVPPVSVHPGHDDAHVARAITGAIAGALASGGGGRAC